MHPTIAATLAKPATHEVVTTYASGETKRFEARGLAAAQNYATGARRKIGRDLIRETTGETVRVVAVEINAI